MLHLPRPLGLVSRLSLSFRPVATRTTQLMLDERAHCAALHPEAFAFLTDRTVTETKKINPNMSITSETPLWDYIMNNFRMKRIYREKLVLLDPAVAKQIAAAIERTSQRGPETEFIDADGGDCGVTREVMDRGLFSKGTVLRKDPRLELLHEEARQSYLHKHMDKLEFNDFHINSLPPKFIASHGKNPAELSMQSDVKTAWSSDVPNFTLFGTVTLGTIRYLLHHCLRRKELNSEFYKGRPELYLLVLPKTMLSCLASPDESTLFTDTTGLLQLSFDVEKILTLPKKSFFPWTNFKVVYKKSQIAMDQIKETKDDIYLLRLRPKADIGLDDKLNAEMFEFFIRIAYGKEKRFIPAMEKYLPDIGMEYIRMGYKVTTKTSDIPLEDLPELLNVAVRSKVFPGSPFEGAYESWADRGFDNDKWIGFDEDEVEKARRKMRLPSKQ